MIANVSSVIPDGVLELDACWVNPVFEVSLGVSVMSCFLGVSVTGMTQALILMVTDVLVVGTNL